MSHQRLFHRSRTRFATGFALIALLAVACDRQPSQQEELDAPPVPTPPMAQETPPPDYPAELGCRQIGGQVVLDVSLAANGVPVEVRVSRSSGVQALDESAIAAVRDWKFKPATVRGRPTASKLQVPVSFTPPNPPPEDCNRYL